MGLRILHLSRTAIAWAPHRICAALNQVSGYEAQWALLQRDARAPEVGLSLQEEPEQVIAAAEAADVIHLHNGVLLDDPDFKDLNLSHFHRRGKAFVRHFHSTPQTASYDDASRQHNMLHDGIPSVVIAQYPERFFKDSYVVPNLIGTDLIDIDKCSTRDIDVSFMPSKMISAWASRWDTKAKPETDAILKRWAKRRGLRYEGPRQRPWDEVLAVRSRCRVCCDDLVTGSYHLAALESMYVGSVSLNYLDERSDYILRYMAGASSHPLVSVPFEQLPMALDLLWADTHARDELGEMSRRWVETHWMDSKQIDRFVEMYRILLDSPDRLKRQGELKHTPAVCIELTLAEVTHASRRRAGFIRYLGYQIKSWSAKLARKIRYKIVLWLKQ